jgi:hypothetical protein
LLEVVPWSPDEVVDSKPGPVGVVVTAAIDVVVVVAMALVGRSASQVNNAVRGQTVKVLVTTSVTITSTSDLCPRAARK